MNCALQVIFVFFRWWWRRSKFRIERESLVWFRQRLFIWWGKSSELRIDVHQNPLKLGVSKIAAHAGGTKQYIL